MDEQRRQQKKEQLKMSHEVYSNMSRHVLEFLKEKQKQAQDGRTDDDEYGAQTEVIVEYLLARNVDEGGVQTVEEIVKFRKIAHAALKRMTATDRILIVTEDNEDFTKKVVAIHPNYVE